MNGVPLADRRDQLACGVAAIDLAAGRICGMLEFQSAVEEVFDVQLVAGHLFPELMGFQKDAIHHTFVVPPEQHDGSCSLPVIPCQQSLRTPEPREASA